MGNFGERLREAREGLEMTQRMLSERSGVDYVDAEVSERPIRVQLSHAGRSLPGPLPYKPRLRSLALIQSIEGQISRIAQTAERNRPPKASRAKRKH